MMPVGNPSIRLLVISARRLVRAGLVAVLRDQPQIECVDERDAPPAAMPDYDPALWDAADTPPRPLSFKFLALLTTPAGATAWPAVGAAGCVLETASVEELSSALRHIARGKLFLSSAVVQQIVSSTNPILHKSKGCADRARD